MKFFFRTVVLFASLIITSCDESGTGETVSQKPSFSARIDDPDITSKVDPALKKENCLVFNTQAEAENFVLDLKKQMELNSNVQFRCAQGIYNFTAWNSIYTSLEFDVSVGSNGCIRSVNGFITGVAFPYSWTQGASSFGCTSGTVCGTTNINIFVENIGTVYSIRQCFRISLSC